MRLIIDIPDEKYERIIKDAQERMYHTNDLFELIDVLKNGTPLDEVKKEIHKLINNTDSIYGTSALHSVLEILDNIGKESESKE